MKPIAHIRCDLKTKFGVPRQSGLVEGLEAEIVFEPEFRRTEALRGLEGFSHVWLLWDFSEAHRGAWSPTVRPPRLGGNKRMGVFATRSPFRPNPIGLSAVMIREILLDTPEGPVIRVEGADLIDGTPILDIKPYLPFTDAHPEAKGGFTDETAVQEPLQVDMPDAVRERFGERQAEVLRQLLAADPRPHYQQDDKRVYYIEYAGEEIRFRVEDKRVIVIA